MTFRERLTLIESQQRTHDNVIPFERRVAERRVTPRWIEWTRENERRGKSLDNRWGGDAA